MIDRRDSTLIKQIITRYLKNNDDTMTKIEFGKKKEDRFIYFYNLKLKPYNFKVEEEGENIKITLTLEDHDISMDNLYYSSLFGKEKKRYLDILETARNSYAESGLLVVGLDKPKHGSYVYSILVYNRYTRVCYEKIKDKYRPIEDYQENRQLQVDDLDELFIIHPDLNGLQFSSGGFLITNRVRLQYNK